MGTRTSIYTNEVMERHLHDLVPKLGGLAPAITIVLDRYQELMRLGRSELRSRGITEDEMFILKSLQARFQPAGLVVGALETALEGGGLTTGQSALLAKLQKLSPLEHFALVDLLEGTK